MPSNKITNLLFDKQPPEEIQHSAESMSGLPITNAPPAPPPLQPVVRDSDPYEFIVNRTPSTSRNTLLGGGSKKARMLIVGVGAFICIILVIIVVGVLNGANSGPKADYLSLAQQQVELIRISDVGLSKARQADAKNLAITAQYTLESQQPAVLGFAKKAGANTSVKSLALGRITKTDTVLATADQTNQFDDTFTQTMQSNLKTYQQTLKKIYDEISSQSTRNVLSKDYTDIGTLIK